MGNIENITYDRFPRQKNLGNLVNIGQGELVPAIVARWDDESPYRVIFKTVDGKYFESSELNELQLPKQENVGRKADVCFHYDTSRTLEGRIVRDDVAEPYITLIELADGRIVHAKECQYRKLPRRLPTEEQAQVVERINPYIEILSTRLKKLKTSKRARELHGIYKQLIPSRKGKIAGGLYNTLVSKYPKTIDGFSVEELRRQIVDRVNINEFVRYIAEQMEKYDHLKNHACRLREMYSNSLRLDFQTVKINSRRN